MRRIGEKRKLMYGLLALAALYVIASMILAAFHVGDESAGDRVGVGSGVAHASVGENGPRYFAIIQPGNFVHVGSVQLRDLDTFGGVARGGRMVTMYGHYVPYVGGRTWIARGRDGTRQYSIAYERVNGDVYNYGKHPVVLVYRRR